MDQIEVNGVETLLGVNDSSQSVLIVNDLKHRDSLSAVAR